MRNAFIDELVSLAKTNDEICLVVGDLGYKVIEPFADEFPERFFNAGVAEQNMMGLSAGLSSEGMHPFVYSIANFPTFRCAEQIRNDVDYHNLNLTVVTVGGGLAYGNLGYSHHAIQDYSLMRTMPNMRICSPGDPYEVRGIMRFLMHNPGPSYLRLGRAGEEVLHENIPDINLGNWLPVKEAEGKNLILSTGASMHIASNLANFNEQYSHYTIPVWGMKSKDIQKTLSLSWNRIVTIEDHLQDGGFGSWLMESLVGDDAEIKKVRNISLDSKICGMVGKQSTLNAEGGLNSNINLASLYE